MADEALWLALCLAPEEGADIAELRRITGADRPCAVQEAGHSQRAIARELSIDRRKVKRIIDQAASPEFPIIMVF